ncbi:MAG: DUF697 domain-containing protein [Desulfobacterales bacterium]|nr:DUF697 domain-containing protein [Desulfobacterales bacterium]MBF0397288.1 DUF697 domain-containing protein [Desulfobacterales bacterium]
MSHHEEEQTAVQKTEGEKTVQNIDITIRNHVLGSMGVGLIPVPIVDLVALTGVQINMLRKMAASYNIPFAQDKVKNILAALIGATIPLAFARAFASLLKIIPLVGQTTSALTLPILAGATTYAVGKVFEQHFASGGTFLNFDPEKVKEYYEKMFKEGQDLAANLKKSE